MTAPRPSPTPALGATAAAGGKPTHFRGDPAIASTVTTDHVAGVPVRHPVVVAAGRHYGVEVRTCEVADPESKLVQLALDAAIAPARVLAGQTQDQLLALARQGGAAMTTAWATAEGRPLAADQLAVPAEDGLRPDQEGCPGRSRQPAAERGQEQAITGLPAWTSDLTLKHAKLMTEQEYFRLETGCGLVTDEYGIEEQAEEAVEEGQEHDPASSQAPARRPTGYRSDFPHPTPLTLAC